MIKTSVGHKMQQKRDIILKERNKVPYSKVPNERTSPQMTLNDLK